MESAMNGRRGWLLAAGMALGLEACAAPTTQDRAALDEPTSSPDGGDDGAQDDGPPRRDAGSGTGDALDTGGPRNDAAPSDAGVGSLGGWHPGADAAADASDPSIVTYSMTIGPRTIQAGEETTVCITARLGNEVPVYVPRITADLANGSHHLVTYRSAAPSESPTPSVCTGFAGILGGNAVPLMISQKAHDDLVFPEGVALKLQPHQMIMLEAHYINPSARALQGQGTVHFETVPVTTAGVLESDLAFWGTMAIGIAPHATASTGTLFKSAIAATHGFAVTTHQHRLGSRFRIWYAQNAGDTSHAPIADTTDWQNAPLYRVAPEMDFNGSNGLAFECEWNNTTDSFITFGESALQEMCFLWMYYYPSHGFDMRLN